MIQKFLQFSDSKLTTADKTLLLVINNPGAIFSCNSVMIIHPENKTFKMEDRQKILDLLTKFK